MKTKRQTVLDVREVVGLAQGMSVAQDHGTVRLLVQDGRTVPEKSVLIRLAREQIAANATAIREAERRTAILGEFLNVIG